MLSDLADAGVIAVDVRWRPRRAAEAGRLPAGRPATLPDAATPAELFAALCQPTRAPDVALTLTEGETLFAFAGRLAEAGFATPKTRRSSSPSARVSPTSSACRRRRSRATSSTPAASPKTPARATSSRAWSPTAEVRGEVFESTPRTPFADELGLSDADLVTIASIVEREAVVPDEEPIIARVVYNRLRRGMKLQMDPTCVYDRALDGQAASPETCRDPASRYSTYVIEGLPPTPIGNPGRSALRATLAPADDPDVLYFVAIGDARATRLRRRLRHAPRQRPRAPRAASRRGAEPAPRSAGLDRARALWAE